MASGTFSFKGVFYKFDPPDIGAPLVPEKIHGTVEFDGSICEFYDDRNPRLAQFVHPETVFYDPYGLVPLSIDQGQAIQRISSIIERFKWVSGFLCHLSGTSTQASGEIEVVTIELKNILMNLRPPSVNFILDLKKESDHAST